MKQLTIIARTLALAATTLAVSAQQPPLITIDEDGNGSIVAGNASALAASLAQDPGPGGLAGTLTYTIPFAGQQGDIGLLDKEFGGAILDIIRFNGDGTIIFYSDNIGGFDALGDTFGPPGQVYDNFLVIPEIGPEGNNGAFYTPAQGQPGWDPSGPSYLFISDSSVPEGGSSVLLLGLAVMGLFATRRWTVRTS